MKVLMASEKYKTILTKEIQINRTVYIFLRQDDGGEIQECRLAVNEYPKRNQKLSIIEMMNKKFFTEKNT